MNITESNHISTDLGIPTWTQNQNNSQPKSPKILTYCLSTSGQGRSTFLSCVRSRVDFLRDRLTMVAMKWSSSEDLMRLNSPKRSLLCFASSMPVMHLDLV